MAFSDATNFDDWEGLDAGARAYISTLRRERDDARAALVKERIDHLQNESEAPEPSWMIEAKAQAGFSRDAAFQVVWRDVWRRLREAESQLSSLARTGETR